MKRILRNKDSGNFLERYYKSFRHAVSGIWYALKYEHNMIIILAAIIVTSLAGFYFNIAAYEWLFVLLCFGCVAATEMINTAIEALVDLETMKYHPLAKIAKDTASGAVLVMAITSAVIGSIILIPKALMYIGLI